MSYKVNKKFFEQYFGELHPTSESEALVKCPFHEDDSPSMSINLNKGLWNCFASGCSKAGDIYTFYQLKHAVDFPTAKKIIQKFSEDIDIEDIQEEAQKIEEIIRDVPTEEKIINVAVVEEFHKDLFDHQKVVEYIKQVRGLTEESIKKFQIGWDGERITIPIYNEEKKIVNIRRYKPYTKKMKMLNYKIGYGESKLFPFENLRKQDIFLCAGEWDTFVALQKGINAVTTTSGEGSWKIEWNEHFKNKNVCIVYDVDQEGQSAAIKIAEALKESTSQIKIVNLPSEIKGYDISNFFVDDKKTIKDFMAIVEKTPYHRFAVTSSEEKDENRYWVHLSQASNEEYYKKNIEFSAIVAGKDLCPYLAPKIVKITCPIEGSFERCAVCCLSAKKEMTIEFKSDDPIILQLLDVSEGSQKSLIKTISGVSKVCSSVNIDIVEKMNVEEIYLIPTIDFSSTGSEYVLRRCFYVGKNIQTNKSYTFKGMTISEPKRQYATQLLSEAKPSQDSVSLFKLTDEIKERLKVFQCKENQSVKDQMYEIAHDLTYNVTQIYDREDILIAMDLVFHSVLAFEFHNRFLNKGWLECLIIGDTRTGKSETAQGLISHYHLGEFITGENTSRAGLIGGMQQTGSNNSWNITWGKIPLNDTKLVVIDEVSSLPESDIANMSGVRSSGVAEITKIRTEKTNARTRLIWLANPRDSRKMNSRKYGIWHIKSIIGKPEDIARFDFVDACSSDEVDVDVINSFTHPVVPHKYESELCRNLILWSWSRTPEHIIFEEESIKRVLEYAIKMGKIYDNEIPIVESADQRIKLAKMAVSTAARLYSTDETGENIIVKPEHVDFVYDFLNSIYKKDSLGYYQMSIETWKRKIIIDRNREVIETFIDDNFDFCQRLISLSYPRNHELLQLFPSSVLDTEQRIRQLRDWHLIEPTTSGNKINSLFIKMIRKKEIGDFIEIEKEILERNFSE